MSRPTLLILGLILLAGAWHIATLRPGHEWGDDFALYLGHARNLAEGIPYADTGYIYNPAYPSLSPRTYPPILPVLAAPVYRLFGLEMRPYKVLLAGLFMLFLLAVFLGTRRELPPAAVAGLIVLLGAHPFLWDIKDRIHSETPFLLFLMTAFALLARLREGGLSVQWRIGLSALAGGFVYLMVGTRTIGVVIVPCVVLQDCLREARGAEVFSWRAWRWPSLVSAAALSVFAVGMAVQKTLLVVEGSYLDQLVLDPQLFLRTFVSVIKNLGMFLDNAHSDLARRVLYLLIAAPALVGYLRCIGRGPTAREIFVPVYVGVMTFWPYTEWNLRYLLPLLPLFLIYFWHGLVVLGEKVRVPVVAPVGAVLTLAVLVSYIGKYTELSFGPLPGIAREEAQQLFDYVRRETPRDAVFLFQRPRALALFTGRHASAHQTPVSDGELWQYLDHIRASYVVVGTPWEESRIVLDGFAARSPDRLREVFHNSQFTIYQIREEVEAAPMPAEAD
jgi:hypothetical protein